MSTTIYGIRPITRLSFVFFLRGFFAVGLIGGLPLWAQSLPVTNELQDLVRQLRFDISTIKARNQGIREKLEKLNDRYWNAPGACLGRLTTESGAPVSTSDRTSQSTIYFTPYQGSSVGLYDGTDWTLYTFTEASLALTGLSSDANYDVFLYNNGGTATLELSTVWTNNTTRANALALQNGVYVKSGTTTRRYVGTIRTTATNATEDSAAKRFVWSHCNRLPRHLLITEATTSWTYNSSTWRSANASNSNRVEFVIGMIETLVRARVKTLMASAASENGGCGAGLGLDSTSTNAAQLWGSDQSSAGHPVTGDYQGYPGIGYHFLQWVEQSADNDQITFIGVHTDSNQYQSGVMGDIEG